MTLVTIPLYFENPFDAVDMWINFLNAQTKSNFIIIITISKNKNVFCKTSIRQITRIKNIFPCATPQNAFLQS